MARGGREWTGALGREAGDAGLTSPEIPAGRLCPRGGCSQLFPRPHPRAPGAQCLDLQKSDPPGPGDHPEPPLQPRPLRPALGRGLSARGPPLARFPQGHARRCSPLSPPSGGTNLRTATRHGRPREETSSGPRGPQQPRPPWPSPRGAAPTRAPSPRAAAPAPPPRGCTTHTQHARAHGLNRVAQPTCSLFSAAITT